MLRFTHNDAGFPSSVYDVLNSEKRAQQLYALLNLFIFYFTRSANNSVILSTIDDSKIRSVRVADRGKLKRSLVIRLLVSVAF